MAKILDSTTFLTDTAIGPFATTITTLEGYDIDDFVHTTVKSQGIRLQLLYRVINADTRLTDNRPRVEVDGISVGGY